MEQTLTKGELKGAQEGAGEFPKRTLRSASKARRKAARGADKSQGRQGNFRATLPSDRDMADLTEEQS